VGAALLAFFTHLIDEGEGLTAQQYALLSGHIAAMFGICLLSCVVPTRRALRIEPMEALSVEG
jgi:ABC-type lipoprotein release transport system permease subunit